MHCQMTRRPRGKTSSTSSGRSCSITLRSQPFALSHLTLHWPYSRRHGPICWQSRSSTKVGHVPCVVQYAFLETTTAKALYRRALAKVALKDDDGARSDLLEANNLLAAEDPLNLKAAISTELAKIAQREKGLKEKEKKAYKKLFA